MMQNLVGRNKQKEQMKIGKTVLPDSTIQVKNTDTTI